MTIQFRAGPLLQQRRGRNLDFIGDFRRYRCRCHFSICLMRDANDCHKPARNFLNRIGAEIAKAEAVAERLGFLFTDQQVNLDQVLEAHRPFEIAFGMDAWKAKRRIELLQDHGETHGTIKTVLGRFHEFEKVREVHDARHVCLGEFDAPGRFEFVGHS
jgi:hypothetical protein